VEKFRLLKPSVFLGLSDSDFTLFVLSEVLGLLRVISSFSYLLQVSAQLLPLDACFLRLQAMIWPASGILPGSPA